MKTIRFFLFVLALSSQILTATAQTSSKTLDWAPILPESRPYTRWWWLGSAVNEEGLKYNLTEYAKAGIGGVEI